MFRYFPLVEVECDVHLDKEKNKGTILSSLEACFVITLSPGDFIVKNIRNHRL